ncbi:MAG: adenylate/guanylate cyclase domain-containing protein [Gemmatimonadota bacterium]|nr:adenylate/guanylate cyclase domain-containing protein [Gemmatimonadota bacterium]
MKRPRGKRPTIHPLTLRFENERVERLFRAGWAASSRLPVRATLLLIAGLFVGYIFLDRVIFPEMFVEHLIIRSAVAAGLLAILVLTWHPAWDRVRVAVLGTAALLSAWGLLGMTWLMPHETYMGFAEGVALVVLGTFTLLRLPFPAAAGIAALVLASYEVAALTNELEREVVLVGRFYVLSAYLIGAFAGYNVERYARRAFLEGRDLLRERARSDRLLRNVLPDPVAERLKHEPGPIADGFDAATVVFSDLVDFSGLSARLEPETLVRFLNELYTDFDRVVREQGLEKIKTMGDAYVAVAGVPIPVEDHVERAAEAALGFRGVAGRRTVNGGHPVKLRLGIATGPVVAGVIGEEKFAYDVWGEPVTLASRMQTLGVADRIQVTEPVVRALEGRYTFEPRGEIDVKGRGRLPVWFLERPAG